MNKYISFFRIRFIVELQYRAAAYAGIVTQFAWGIMNILAFYAFYKSSPSNFPMEFSQVASYVWLRQAFLALLASHIFQQDIFDSIRTGNISYELCRPTDIYNMWFAKNMATRLSKVSLRLVPVIVVSMVIPKPYGLSLPDSSLSFLLFLISLFLGFIVIISLIMLVYISTFYTMTHRGVRLIFIAAAEFLSGSLIPLPFLPKKIQEVFEILPFASIENVPFRIYSGNINGKDAIFYIMLQIIWVIVLIVYGKILMKNSLKRVIVQGG